MIENRLSEEYVSILQDVVDCWEEKWTKEHNDRVEIEKKLRASEAQVMVLENEILVRGGNDGIYVTHSHHNEEVYFWQRKWARERDDRVFLEKRLKLAQIKLKLLGIFARRVSGSADYDAEEERNEHET